MKNNSEKSDDSNEIKSSIKAGEVRLLDSINKPADLRKLDVEQLPTVCSEIRDVIISSLSSNPGHFASSMGAVEIATAVHYVFNTPYDRIVWDVGHQAYSHKILTGRKDAIYTQRTLNGISGFPNPMESEYDTFVAGHAGNSISAALGMAIADANTPGSEERHTVAIIGDASISGGLAFEGLNNASNNPNNLLIILNDNDMSIDSNVGALHKYLSRLTTSAGYNRFRHKTSNWLRKIGFLTDARRQRIIRFNNSVKALISSRQNIFEGLNIRYFGPFDGHDVKKLVNILEEIKDMKGPRILHLSTVKGKGFEVAENNPSIWHAPGKFNPDTGERKKSSDPAPMLWQQVFGESLVEMADKDERIMGITAAMPSGTSINMMLDKYPSRTFDVGISEGHAVTFAGGLAAAGKLPVVAIYSSFLQRAYDNIIHDVAIQKLPVLFCIDRAGFVGEDGVTHHGLLDMMYLQGIPNISVASPYDAATLRNLMFTFKGMNAPLAIRYPRGKSDVISIDSEMKELPIGKARILRQKTGTIGAILSIGPIGKDAVAAAEELEKEGIMVDIYDMIWLKPIDRSTILEAAGKYQFIITLEDGVKNGGLGTTVESIIMESGSNIPVRRLGAPDKWIAQGTVDELHKLAGIDKDSIIREVKNLKTAIS